jgi:uncharacterized protein (TIGR00369 family)
MDAPNPCFREVIAAALKGQRLMQYLGCELLHLEPGHAIAEVTLQEHHQQQLGIVHGGLIATLADVAAGFASFTLTPAGLQPVTVDLHVLFFQPGRGERLRAIGRVLHAGNRLHFAEARIVCLRNGTETLIAQATSTLALIRVSDTD